MMKRIASFEVNHNTLLPGLYVSRVDGDVVTYDLRFVRPNTPPYLANGVLHTLEHLFATYVRNSPHAGDVVYFGPMGCRTGFYFLTRDSLPPAEAIGLVREAAAFCAGFEGGVPGTRPEECGNYREHDLPGAKTAAAVYWEIVKNWTPERLRYPS